MLPQRFAVFDKSAGEPHNSRRFYEKRYAICEWSVDADQQLFIHPWHTETQRRNAFDVVESNCIAEPVQFLPGHYYWKTRYDLKDRISEETIPILDFSHYGFRRELVYPFTAENDSLEFCVRRQSEARRLMNRMTSMIYTGDSERDVEVNYLLRPIQDRTPTPIHLDEPIPPPPLAAVPSTIPKFVADLIKEKAILSGDACPISMNPFTKEMSCTVTSCYHLFEKIPLRMWLSKPDSSCPTCKQPVRFCVDDV